MPRRRGQIAPLPDPSGLAAVNPMNPQSWDPYGYVDDDPMNATDPLGLLGTTSGPNCGNPCNVVASPWNLLSPSYWWFSFGIDGAAELQHVTGGGGVAPSREPAPQAKIQLSPSGPACEQRILTDVNNQFQTGANSADVIGLPFTNGGGINFLIQLSNIPAGEFNHIQTGRYPVHWWSYLLGVGPALHIAGPDIFDKQAVFRNSNIGGVTSVLFTAHSDDGFAYNPIGLVVHFLDDVLQLFGPRNPRP